MSKEHQYIVTGLAITLGIFMLGALVQVFSGLMAFWLAMICCSLFAVVYQVVEIFFTVKRIQPDTRIIPPGFTKRS
jgi:uncharacterized membrane protein